MPSENLHGAKLARNDEFYTQYSDISDEMSHYRDHFAGKAIYCNCDDPTWSNFWKYFHNNFASLQLKRLVSTHYQKDNTESYAMMYEGGDDFNMDAGTIIPIHGNDGFTAGDFRSNDCVALLKQADIVVTNPPFSLFRQYVTQLFENEKHFIIIGSLNSVKYTEFFPYFKAGKVWTGATCFNGGAAYFIADKSLYDPEKMSNPKNAFLKDGVFYWRVNGVRWYTNLDITKRHDGLWHMNGKFDTTQAHSYYEGHEVKYPKYDNCDAIEVAKFKDTPIDYEGIIGVPISMIDHYNPDEFEILGCTQKGMHDAIPFEKDYSEYMEYTKNGKATGASGKKTNGNANLAKNDGKHNYFSDNNGHVIQSCYDRIFVRNLHPIKKSDDLGY